MKESARCITLLKLTTDGQKAMRGLSATAELLISITVFNTTFKIVQVEQCCDLQGDSRSLKVAPIDRLYKTSYQSAVDHSSILYHYRAMLCISAVYAGMRCLSVCLSRSWIMSKRINVSSNFFHLRVATPF